MSAEEKDPATALAEELKKNRELTRKLYTLRGEAPPNDHRLVLHAVMRERGSCCGGGAVHTRLQRLVPIFFLHRTTLTRRG